MLTVLQGDALAQLKTLPDESVHCCVTSPPYWGLRDYGTENQLGLEKTPEEYVAKMVDVFRDVRRVLRKDGTLWLNLGDSYAVSWGNYGGGDRGAGTQRLIKHGSSAPNPVWDGLEDWRPPASFQHDTLKPKDLVGIPWRVAFALQADGWWLRSDIIWAKPNPMPESVTDRPTKSHEYIFLLTKSAKYYYDAEAISESVAYSSIERLSQPTLETQAGSDRVPGKTNGPMKAVLPGYFKGSMPERNGGPGQDRRSQTDRQPKRSGNKERKSALERGCPADGVDGSVPWEGFTRNKRSVWTVTTKPYPEAHFATYPPELITPCILAGSPVGGTVLDPFGGSGTTGQVAIELARKVILIELNPKYIELIKRRCDVTPGLPLAV